jgi:myo-inositol-1(or 4)-monophosphatase
LTLLNSFIGEETYTPGQRLSEAPTFIVDPIDGTTNFLHANQYVCISLGFVVNRTPQVGVVYNPFTSTLYTGIRGHGAFVRRTGPNFVNEKAERLPLRDQEPLDLSTALVAVEWGSDRSGNDMAVKANTFRRLAASTDEGGAMVHSLRSLGSAALNLCAVAAGQLDAYWEAGCWAWDVAAGWCILNEAGGFMAGVNPGEWEVTLEGRRYLAVRAAGEEGQRQFIEKFWTFVEGKFEVGV